MIKNNINYAGYHKMFHELYADRLQNVKRELNQLIDSNKETYNTIKNNVDAYLSDYNIDLYQYEEFKNNEYSTGELLLKISSICTEDIISSDIYLLHLYIYCKNLKSIADLTAKFKLFSKYVDLTSPEFRKILATFYVTVQRRMLINAEAYDFENNLGMVLLITKYNGNRKKIIDFAATLNKKKEVVAKGLKVYNDVEAAWCAERGILYDGIDCRVYRHDKYITFAKLFHCRLDNEFAVRFIPTDYNIKNNIPTKYVDILNHFDYNMDALVDAVISFRKKISLCNMLDSDFYKKFIRYEYKKQSNITTSDR